MIPAEFDLIPISNTKNLNVVSEIFFAFYGLKNKNGCHKVIEVESLLFKKIKY